MRTVTINRQPDNGVQTLGILNVLKQNNQLFVSKTLELAWKNNKGQISCIPKGEYLVKWTLSPRLGYNTYEVMNVPTRGGIRIHNGNFYTQIKGCILMGSALKDINSDGQQDVVHSGDTLKSFEKEMNYEDFELIIS